nr:hypothetical protein CFP56_16724 [Quercus suber]
MKRRGRGPWKRTIMTAICQSSVPYGHYSSKSPCYMHPDSQLERNAELCYKVVLAAFDHLQDCIEAQHKSAYAAFGSRAIMFGDLD